VAAWKADSVVLLTGGEPFLRKDIFEVIGHAVSLGLNAEVVTNGSLIDASLAKKIIASGLKNIAVSLDGAGGATHDFIRGVPGAFDRAVQALRYLVEEKKRSGSGPQISIWTTIMKENVGELSAVIPLAVSIGVECLVYHPVVVCQDDMQNTIADGHFWITRNDMAVLEEQIKAIAAYQKERGLVAFLHDPFMWTDYFKGTLTRDKWTCHPYVFVDIGPDGEVRSCGPSFGNIKKMSLDDCLKTPEADRARERMRRCAKPCLQTCWARPEADSLNAAVKEFLSDLDSSGHDKDEKRRFIEKGIACLDAFEERISRNEIDR
jgi:MoaA/NifB/PqqE/SkfB family radical SAM enzyme